MQRIMMVWHWFQKHTQAFLFQNVVELAGEAKNSDFGIPLAVIGSVVCCLILYVGLQEVFIGALHPDLKNKNVSFRIKIGYLGYSLFIRVDNHFLFRCF